MQEKSQKDAEDTVNRRYRVENRFVENNVENALVDSELIARYFKYYMGLSKNPRCKSGLWNVKILSIMKKYGCHLDKLAAIVNKYGINHDKFIKFCIFNQKINTPADMLSGDMFARFAAYLKMNEEYAKIYERYMKSADFIADRCIEKCMNPSECIGEMITDNTLAIEYVSGHISKHFIASIQNFKELFWKLDNINREELGIIYDAAETLNENVQESFLMFTNKRVTPINLIEKIITNKLNNKTR